MVGCHTTGTILDTIMYEVEYDDGYKTSMTANTIASNLFSQVDQDGQHFFLFNATIDSRTNSTQIKEGDYFIHMFNGTRGVERPLKDGKFAYNVNMVVLLVTKVSTSGSPFRYNYQSTQYSTKSQMNQNLHGG